MVCLAKSSFNLDMGVGIMKGGKWRGGGGGAEVGGSAAGGKGSSCKKAGAIEIVEIR